MEKKTVVADFDVLTVPLEGSNLIEASAGTGKTFSIAILALRLILRQYLPSNTVEKDTIYINQILMVTFTTAAVAELESRIRKYIYIAERYVTQSEEEKSAVCSENPMIATIVDLAIQNAPSSNEVQQVLRDNLLLLDEANILTIHSFCQSTLNEFAIETNQLFGVELYTETDKLLDIELNKFWRKNITTLASSILRELDLERKRKDIKDVVRCHLDGKSYSFYDSEKDYSITDFNQLWIDIDAQIEHEKNEAIDEINIVLEELSVRECIEKSAAVKKSKEKYLNVLGDIAAFAAVYSSDTSKIKTILPESLTILLDNFIAQYDKVENYKQQLFFVTINNLAIQEITKSYRQFLSVNNYVTYDELIDKLHIAVNGIAADRLKEKLNEKYKAVFVDEFQDTDKKQYEIFFETFVDKGILFLIGDPKQSIYGWRKADMLTYFKARENVRQVYQMNVNYRSSAVAIDAMNAFFKPKNDFDTFYYQNEPERIDYIPVEAPENSTKGALLYNSEACAGMTLIDNLPNKDAIVETVANISLQLLTDENYSLKNRAVVPSDIGIVVRTNQQAMQVKKALSVRNIPSVVINEEKVLTSDEALDILYLLHAVLTPSLSKINRFLMADIVGFDYRQLLRIDDNKVLDIFQELSTIWTKDGVYPMLIRFASVFGIENKWTQQTDGERKLTNFFHVTELLNQMEKKKNYSPDELIAWLQRSIDGLEHTGDEYELRMESDENAVKIITIHKSKGLEYNIVLAPFLDLNSSITPNRTFVQFYDKATAQYVTKDALLLSKTEKQDYKIEQERENRRLLYVAITRAAFKFYVLHSKREKNSSLAAFYSAFNSDIIVDATFLTFLDNNYIGKKESTISYPLEAEHFELREKNWHKLSFTGLSFHGDSVPKERTKLFKDAYDSFVFDQLKFGAASGNLLHDILEEVDFTSDKRHEEIVRKKLQRYLSSDSETLLPNMLAFLQHILHTDIVVDDQVFKLNQIPNYKRLSELEFDFPIKDFDYYKLPHIVKEQYPVQVRSFESTSLQGLMNGKIDLFFEHDGRYYILDWKSNYLGFRLDDYNKDGVFKAMTENNYHLQYLLYIVAVKKMLESRLPYFNYEKQFGGVIYLFLRGVREGGDSGIFTAKPSYRTIAALARLLY